MLFSAYSEISEGIGEAEGVGMQMDGGTSNTRTGNLDVNGNMPSRNSNMNGNMNLNANGRNWNMNAGVMRMRPGRMRPLARSIGGGFAQQGPRLHRSCVPDRLDSLEVVLIMSRPRGLITRVHIPNMVVTSCKCVYGFQFL